MGSLSKLQCTSFSCWNSAEPIVVGKTIPLSNVNPSTPQTTSENDYDNPTSTGNTTSTGSGKNKKPKGGSGLVTDAVEVGGVMMIGFVALLGLGVFWYFRKSF